VSWAHEHLGIGDDADERAIKRAYAAKLRTTRPDEDPEGFQRLHEAYQAALDWARSGPHEAWNDEIEDEGPDDGAEDRAVGPDEERTTTGAAAVAIRETLLRDAAMAEAAATADETPATGDAMQVDVFDHDAFFDACFDIARHGGRDELQRWLDAQPILWSLQYKAQIGHWLLQAMHAQQPAMPPARFDQLANYFGLLDLRSGYDAYFIQRLRHRLQIAWELRTSQLRALAERTADEGTSVVAAMRQTARILRDLSRPFALWRALLSALMPMYPSAVRRFLYRLDHGHLDDLPPPIEPAQVAFWIAASDRSRLPRQRLAVVGARLLAYTALATLLYFGLTLLATPDHRSADAGTWASIPLHQVAVFSASAMGLAWLLWTAYDLFATWQSREDAPDERRPMLRRFAIPALLAIALAIAWTAPDGWIGGAGSVLLMAAALAAWSRHRERSGPPLGRHLGYWRVFVLFVIVRAIGEHQGWMDDAGVFGAIAGLALCIWAKDLWHQRRTRTA
jgi:hypothetical protein